MSSTVYSALRLVVAAVVCAISLPSVSASQSNPNRPDFVELSKRLKPSVVNIRTAKTIKPRQRLQQRPRTQTPFDNFFDEFFNQFDQMPQRQRREQSLGTGFIIAKEGFILTNNHVVNGADEVMVKLSDGREMKGELKGFDEKLDLALIKVSGKEDLPFAELGDSDALQVGEWVIAIGNPFGLGQTITAGIVSAKGRVIGSGPYDDYIQTDASINPGNSGGPLFDVNGKVVGINTAIVAGGQGIGFAIPINMAKSVISQLRESGKVTRGYLGVRYQQLTADLAKSFGLDTDKGALVASVEKDSPAEKAGLKAGDIILEYDGKPIHEGNELPRYVAATPVDKKVKMVIFRDGKKQTVTLAVGLLKDTDGTGKPGAGEMDKIGLTVQNLTKDLADRLGIKDTKGVVITDVKQGSPADEAGVVPGSILVEINGVRIEGLDKYTSAVSGLKKGDVVRLLLRRPDGSIHYVAMKVE